MSAVETFMPKVNGKSFRCECGCNVFHKEPCPDHALEYVCNACGQRYEGVRVESVTGEATDQGAGIGGAGWAQATTRILRR